MGTPELIAVFAVILTNLTTVITLHLQADRKIDAILAEMKDFHGRLCAIEERGRK